MIVASALSPALVGIALDLGASMNAALSVCLALILLAGPLARMGIRAVIGSPGTGRTVMD